MLLSDEKLAEIQAAMDDHARAANSASVVEVERSYPKSEVKAAREARMLQERLFFPSDYTLMKALTTGSVFNCGTVPKAVKLA